MEPLSDFSKPAIIFNNVDLPHPFGPTIEIDSPSFNENYSTAKHSQIEKRTRLDSQKSNLNTELVKLQSDFNNEFLEDYNCGYNYIDKFYDIKDKLVNSTIVDYESKIIEAKSDKRNN